MHLSGTLKRKTMSLDQTQSSKEVWESYYQSIEPGAVGCLYPNEPLVRILSTIRKGITLDNSRYFGDQGKENTNRRPFEGSALEIGFGHISNLLMVEEKGFAPVGLEVSQESVLRGCQRLRKCAPESKINLNYWEDLEHLPYTDRQFSLIYGLQCLYYNVNLDQIISEVYRCLKPGGFFAFSFFSIDHDYQKYIDILEEKSLYKVVKWSDNHPNPRLPGAILAQPKSKESLDKLFEKFSVRRIFTETSNFSPTFNSWWYIYGQK